MTVLFKSAFCRLFIGLNFALAAFSVPICRATPLDPLDRVERIKINIALRSLHQTEIHIVDLVTKLEALMGSVRFTHNEVSAVKTGMRFLVGNLGLGGFVELSETGTVRTYFERFLGMPLSDASYLSMRDGIQKCIMELKVIIAKVDLAQTLGKTVAHSGSADQLDQFATEVAAVRSDLERSLVVFQQLLQRATLPLE